MRPPGLVFGMVFLLLGASLLIGSSLVYSRRLRSAAKVAQEHPNEVASGLLRTICLCGPGCMGGFVLLAAASMKFMRRRQAQ